MRKPVRRQALTIPNLERLEGQYRGSKDSLGKRMHELYSAQLRQRYAESGQRMAAAYRASEGSKSGRRPRPRFD